jgi:hypothetical protein
VTLCTSYKLDRNAFRSCIPLVPRRSIMIHASHLTCHAHRSYLSMYVPLFFYYWNMASRLKLDGCRSVLVFLDLLLDPWWFRSVGVGFLPRSMISIPGHTAGFPTSSVFVFFWLLLSMLPFALWLRDVSRNVLKRLCISVMWVMERGVIPVGKKIWHHGNALLLDLRCFMGPFA